MAQAAESFHDFYPGSVGVQVLTSCFLFKTPVRLQRVSKHTIYAIKIKHQNVDLEHVFFFRSVTL